MVKGLILHVLTAPEYEGRRNLVTVRKSFCAVTGNRSKRCGLPGRPIFPLGTGCCGPASRTIQLSTAWSPASGDSFTNMLVNSPKQFESVLQVANRNTEFIDSPAMQRLP